MTDKIILVVSFGTSYNNNRALTIGAIEKDIDEAFPDYEMRRAFTSQMVINILKKRDDLAIDNVKCVGTLPTAPKNDAIHASVAPAGFKATLHGNTLQMTVAKAGLVKIQVLDMMGHAIESHSEKMAAGSFAHTFKTMPSGQYIVRVQQGSASQLLKMQVR